jgi:hypothetical protein
MKIASDMGFREIQRDTLLHIWMVSWSKWKKVQANARKLLRRASRPAAAAERPPFPCSSNFQAAARE